MDGRDDSEKWTNKITGPLDRLQDLTKKARCDTIDTVLRVRGQCGIDWFDSDPELEGWVLIGFGIRIFFLRFLLANEMEVPMNQTTPTTLLRKIRFFLVTTFCAYGIFQLFHLTIAAAATPLLSALC